MMTFTFTGGKELAENLANLSARVSKKVQREALRHAAEPMRGTMSTRAPHEPGKPDLRDSIVISNFKGEDAQEVAIAVGPNREGFYGSFQEFGTSFHAAQPFVRPSFDEHAHKALQMIAEDLWVSMAARGIRQFASVDVPVIGGPGGSLT